LPDLAPRIQVALFNILEENDVQVRGIPLRLPLDLLLVFTANPEDYTSRGQIVTPLKDRIGAQILTHYPRSRAEGVVIQRQEAELAGGAGVEPVIHPLFHDLIEEAARAARGSEYVDQKSGVSERLTIAALEALHANVLRRGLATGATMRAAVLAVRQQAPARLIVAVPVGARDSCEALADVADEVVCPFMPEPFQAVGLWYDPMTQASDEEVCEILNRARTERSLAIRQSAQTGSPAPSR